MLFGPSSTRLLMGFDRLPPVDPSFACRGVGEPVGEPPMAFFLMLAILGILFWGVLILLGGTLVLGVAAVIWDWVSGSGASPALVTTQVQSTPSMPEAGLVLQNTDCNAPRAYPPCILP